MSFFIIISMNTHQKPPPNFAKLPGGLGATVGVIDHGYPEDGKMIFQDIGASKAPQSDCASQPAADCANQPAADCSPTRHRQDPDETAIPRTRQLYRCTIMYSVTCPWALFMK